MTKTEEIANTEVASPEVASPEVDPVEQKVSVSFIDKYSEQIIKILLVIVIIAIGYSLLVSQTQKTNKVVPLGLQTLSGGSIDFHFLDNM
jgi:hypothetical protein